MTLLSKLGVWLYPPPPPDARVAAEVLRADIQAIVADNGYRHALAPYFADVLAAELVNAGWRK